MFRRHWRNKKRENEKWRRERTNNHDVKKTHTGLFFSIRLILFSLYDHVYNIYTSPSSSTKAFWAFFFTRPTELKINFNVFFPCENKKGRNNDATVIVYVSLPFLQLSTNISRTISFGIIAVNSKSVWWRGTTKRERKS